jgi:lipoprotein-anchoring transpeptidase ErfK/SrfK
MVVFLTTTGFATVATRAADQWHPPSGEAPSPTMPSPASPVSSGTRETEGITTSRPTQDAPEAPDHYLDVDLTRQTLSEIRGGEVVSTARVSTGSEKPFWEDGVREVAHTPRGEFEVYDKLPGWVTAPLGSLFDPLYFTGGFAIHGSDLVPDYPASHGCVRVSLADAEGLYERVPVGTPVFVHD